MLHTGMYYIIPGPTVPNDTAIFFFWQPSGGTLSLPTNYILRIYTTIKIAIRLDRLAYVGFSHIYWEEEGS